MLRGLFSKNDNETEALLELPPEGVSADECLDFLRGLEKSAFDKMMKVVNIYRDADQKAEKVYNVKFSDPGAQSVPVKIVKNSTTD